MMRYLTELLPWLAAGEGGDLGLWGKVMGVAMLVLLTALNALGVAFLVRFNAGLTWLKVGLPLLVAVLIAADRFVPGNFTAHGGFAPAGREGVLGAIASGGVIFAYLGFRHVIDMAGEARRPQVTVPAALGLTILICMILYGALQIAFIGAVDDRDLAGGWAKLSFDHALGPLGAIAVALGMVWLSFVVLAGALVSPFGAALVAAGSNARLSLALARNGFFPELMTRLSARQVPLNALILNVVVSAAMLLFMPFDEIVALVGAALTFSLVMGPLALLALRRQAPEAFPGFRLPFAVPVCVLSIVVATLVIYWSGWDTVWRLGVALAIGAVLFAVMSRGLVRAGLHARQALWLVPYLAGLGLLSWLGNYGGGTGLIPQGWDTAAGAALGILGLVLGMALCLDPAEASLHRSQAEGFDTGSDV